VIAIWILTGLTVLGVTLVLLGMARYGERVKGGLVMSKRDENELTAVISGRKRTR
jgi:hypothetical protein